MALHIAIMNVAAPLVAAWTPVRPVWMERRGFLVAAALAQMILLWAWHLPAVHRMASMPVHALMMTALAFAALAFWIAIVAAAAERRWSAIAALLLTGKLACLLGALLIFAPGAIYGPSVDDQHLAGLFMITACPLSYVVAGIVLAVQALADLERGRRCAAS
jgi:putative membrane protein